MYKGKKHIRIRIFFLALFLSFYADITFFTHSHIIHGVAIVHSHFICATSSDDTDQPADHSHSDKALTLISQANAWTAAILQSPEVPQVTVTSILIRYAESCLPANQSAPTSFYLRGPPAQA